ncbi:hypothetical protein [Streptomyces hygroscopicus]|uniref:hypothetical protein n=1 Tax=Streptomyces hygroscopicus TaxID=1912 RepID=UPI000AF11733|nr:hypothetical protein [Streptomyces hygroscopicus]GLV79045.1 hypothetical protein Shyhy02_70450 [Streptomyces hygroscopicus subsp. hygroscopicus]
MSSSNTVRTVRTVRRRTLRVAAAALIAAAGLSLTACSGSDDTSAKSAATAKSSSAGSSAGAQGSDATIDTKAGTSNKAASPSRTEPLADGSTAEIYQLGDQHYRLKIVHDGDVLATLEANEHDAGLDANDMFVVITAGGEVRSWMGGGHQGPGTFALAGGWKAKVTKVGELRYRAQIIGHDGVAATMKTNGHDAGLDANGVAIVLSAGGVISAHE